MDWDVQNGTATVMSMADGSASVYLSSGGGFIGGKGIEAVRWAAQRAVSEATSLQLPEHSTTHFPLPGANEAVFYFLTDVGVFKLATNLQELSSQQHGLRKLWEAMQAVITEFRAWQARAKSKNAQQN
jgi:hypothetical protein